MESKYERMISGPDKTDSLSKWELMGMKHMGQWEDLITAGAKYIYDVLRQTMHPAPINHFRQIRYAMIEYRS